MITRTGFGRAIARLLVLCLIAQSWPSLWEVRTSAATRVFLDAGSGEAGFTAFGPRDYVRASMTRPVIESDTFAAEPGPYALRIDNGGAAGQYARVSGAVIALNDVVIVAPHEFSQDIAFITKVVPLSATNTLTVELRSLPGSGLTIQIVGEAQGNRAPMANAGADQTSRVGQTVTLDGTASTDADGDALTYQWAFASKPAGSAATLSDPSAIRPTFVVDQPGTYEIELVVNDGALSSAPDRVRVTTENSPPVANAGADQTAPVGTLVTLDGAASTDADGDSLTYQWTFTSRPAGSTATLSDPTAARPTFVVDSAGSYTVQLVVNDGYVDSAPDSVFVRTSNSSPVADAGPDQTARVGATVTLDGGGSRDVDGDALTFRWSLTSVPAGSMAALSDAAAMRPTFVVDRPGTYLAQLIVNDGSADSAPDMIVVTTTNSPPTANAGADQSVLVGSEVTLDGSGSADVDGDALTFRWSLTSVPAGSAAVLSDPGVIAPTFTIDLPGSYVAQLIVNDGTVDSTPDTVLVTTANSGPVANAGPDQSAVVGAMVTLDGSGSRDADGDALTFRWAFIARPAGSAATLSDSTAVRPTFTVDRAGAYVVQLIVNDGMVDSAPDTMSVTTTNSAPVANAGADQSGFVGTTVRLDGSGSTDVDGDELSFRWSLTSVPAGSSAALSDPTAVAPTFVVDRPGVYVAQLIVNDGIVDSAPDTVVVTTENSVPVADAGPDQTVLVGALVTLDGRASRDADGDALTHRWAFTSRPVGSIATLSDDTALSPTFSVDRFGVYVVQLIVNDGTVDSAPDTVVITTANSAPVANAGADQSVLVGDTVALNGTASRDADGHALTYSWSLTVRPAGSAATLSDSTAASPTFVADRSGVYVAQLIVNDGTVDSTPDTVMVRTANRAPIAAAGTDQTVLAGDTVMLNGSGSSDPDADPLTYLWSFDTVPAGSTAALIDPTTATPTFVADLGGAYVVRLVVSDASTSAADTVAVTALVSVPDVAGRERAAAESAITGAGLVVGAVTFEDSDTVPAGHVIRQAPAAGVAVAAGSAVDLVVSSGTGVPMLQSIAVQPAIASLADGQKQQYTATGTWSDGHIEDVTGSVVWTSIRPDVASITVGGLAEALDAGDTIIQASRDGITGSANLTVNPARLASIVVTPAASIALVGETRGFVATGVLTDGTSQHLTTVTTWNTTDLAIATIDATGVASAVAAGAVTVTATRDGVVGMANLTVQARAADGTSPAAAITTPANNALITTRVDVRGTATDANFSQYVLDYAPAGTTSFAVLTTGTAPVAAGGVLGTLDPSLLINDIYTLRLRVFDRGGNVNTASINIQVTRDEKVGIFTLTFEDLNVPVAGLPIQINRVYDSREKRSRDFGVGWTLDVQAIRLRANRVQGTGWQVNRSGGFFPTYTLVATDQHKISITLPDGKVEEFDLTITPSSSSIVPLPNFGLTASYSARPGTLGTLVALDGNSVGILDPQPGPVTLVDDFDFEVYDPQTFRYTAVDGKQYVINKTAGVQTVTDPNGNRLTFGPGGITHSSGQSITFTRDALGRITQIRDPMGNLLRYTYDGNGDLASYTDAIGARTRFFYNLNHGLIEIRDPLGRRGVRNEYDAEGRLVAHVDAEGNRLEYTHNTGARQEVVQDRNGFVTVYEYDAAGNVINSTDPAGARWTYTYDAQGNRLSETDPLGNVATFTYDARKNRLTETRTVSGAVVTTRWTYNALGKVLTTTNALGRVTTNTYDARGNLLETIDPLGNRTRHTYDARGNILSTTDGNGVVTTFTYDALDNMATMTTPAGVTRYTYDANGNKLTETDPRGAVTRFTYDASNRLIAVENAVGATKRTEYNLAGYVSAEVDPLGQRTIYEYSGANRLIKTTLPDGTILTNQYDREGNRISATDQQGRTTRFAYDGRNKLTKVTLPDGGVEQYAYDLAGRRLSVTDPRRQVTAYAYDSVARETSRTDPMGRTTTSEYDAVGNLVARTDPNGNRTSWVYDAVNRAIEKILPGGQRNTIAYDALGQKTSETDAAGSVTQYTYDALGRLIIVTDAEGGVTRHEYDASGNRTAQVDARGRRTSFAYDLANRAISRTLPGGTTEAYTYDPAGRLALAQDGIGRTIQFTYDPRGRLVRRTYPDASTVQFTYTPTGKRATAVDARGTTRYTYDSHDRLIEQVNPDGQRITYTYDANGNLLTVGSFAGTMTYGYDNSGRLISVTDPAGGVTTYGYDAAGNRTSLNYPNGTRAAYTYDVSNRLTSLTHRDTVGAVMAGYTYTLGPTGTRTRIDESTGAVKHYNYDRLFRLTNEQVTDLALTPVYSNAFAYDAVGNRTSLTTSIAMDPPVTNTYSYDAADQLLSENAVAYTYDANGNMTSRTDATGVTTFEYDFHNRLFRITEPSGATTLNVYDADGNRVEKRDVSGIVRYLVDSNRQLAQVLAEYSPAGVLVASYVYADELISMTRGGATWFYHADGLGSTRLLTNTAGMVTDTYQYDAFGTLVNRTGTTVNPFLFNGQALDANVGFYYLRARFYQPAAGRFISRDPLDGDVFSPLSLHKYVYAGCDPVNKVDPSGLLVCTSNLLWGRLVHNHIGADFVASGPGRFSDQSIGVTLGLTGLRGIAGALLRPDLTDVPSREIYEIKPILSQAEGYAKMAIYLAALNRLDPAGGWSAGFSYRPPTNFHIAPGVQVLVFPPAGGVIVYCVINWTAIFALIAAAAIMSLRPVFVPAPSLAFAF